MSTINQLNACTSIDDLASLLGYKASGISFILYKTPAAGKYTIFEVPKKLGEPRVIHAPNEQLKGLQRRLATILYQCVDELVEAGAMSPLSHGFRRGRSIVTNAKLHQRRRYVLNLDISDFFPAFNFGRVRGYFIKDERFSLHPKIATLVAQIACFDGGLPQGSPCSPIIADLIAGVLDGRLARMAKTYKVTYSRYADDLTFSTSKRNFPLELAELDPASPAGWKLGAELVSRIEGAGFGINHSKTRMQCRGSRQVVTGLTVNAKVNTAKNYYKIARSMSKSLFGTGKYHMGDGNFMESIHPLAGILSHIHFVKDRSDLRGEIEKRDVPTAFRRLYADFIFFRYFVMPDKPFVVCEGKTDSIYLKLALPRLKSFHPFLGFFDGDIFNSRLGYFRYDNLGHKILNIGGGQGGLTQFLSSYKKSIARYGYKPMEHPVIILTDNDSGGETVRKTVNGCFKKNIPQNPNDLFYHVVDNIYVVFTPLKVERNNACIEDLFDPSLLKVELEGKKLNLHKEHGAEGEYGKMAFAESVVRPNAASINFDGFAPLFERISGVIVDYEAKMIA